MHTQSIVSSHLKFTFISSLKLKRSYEHILKHIGAQRQVLKNIQKKRWIVLACVQYDIWRTGGLLSGVLEGKIQHKRKRGRPRNNYITQADLCEVIVPFQLYKYEKEKDNKCRKSCCCTSD